LSQQFIKRKGDNWEYIDTNVYEIKLHLANTVVVGSLIIHKIKVTIPINSKYHALSFYKGNIFI